MGVGKGSVARELAKQTGMFVLDSDDLIESKCNKKIKKIFKEEGEKFFRLQEQILSTWFIANVKNTILSTGGGFSIYVQNIKKMGKVILLENSFDEIYKRLQQSPNWKKKISKRPLFASPQEAQKLFEVRAPIYKKLADIVINTSGKTEQEVAQEIKKFL